MKKIKLFKADWCRPCKHYISLLKERNLLDQFEFIDLETEEGKNLAKKYNVKRIPTLIDHNGDVLEINDFLINSKVFSIRINRNDSEEKIKKKLSKVKSKISSFRNIKKEVNKNENTI